MTPMEMIMRQQMKFQREQSEQLLRLQKQQAEQQAEFQKRMLEFVKKLPKFTIYSRFGDDNIFRKRKKTNLRRTKMKKKNLRRTRMRSVLSKVFLLKTAKNGLKLGEQIF